jgi:hypothetical protein
MEFSSSIIIFWYIVKYVIFVIVYFSICISGFNYQLSVSFFKHYLRLHSREENSSEVNVILVFPQGKKIEVHLRGYLTQIRKKYMILPNKE